VRARLLIAAVDGTGDRLVAATGSSTGIGGAPTWSPDGSQLAYVDGRDVWAVQLDGSARRALTSFPADQAPRFAGTPTWAPHGSAIAFVTGSPSSANADDVWIVRSDGGTPKRLARFAYVDSGASWMPDGREFLLTAAKRREGDVDIYRLAVDGSAPVNVSNDRVWDEGAAVAPDGTRIAFGVRYGHGFLLSDIWTLDLGSGRRRNLTGTSTGLTVAARSVRPPNTLVLRSVGASVDRTFRRRPLLRLHVHVQDARRNDVRNAVVTVMPSLPSLAPMKPTHRTDVHGETGLDLRATTPHALRAGRRLTLVVSAYPPGPHPRGVKATRRIAIRV
jgi:Tol biopolymer transport system component